MTGLPNIIYKAANDYFAFEVSVLYEPDPLIGGLRYCITFVAYALTTMAAGAYCSKTKNIRVPAVVGLGAFIVFNGEWILDLSLFRSIDTA